MKLFDIAVFYLLIFCKGLNRNCKFFNSRGVTICVTKNVGLFKDFPVHNRLNQVALIVPTGQS